MVQIHYGDDEAASALMKVLGGNRWVPVCLARMLIAAQQGHGVETAARAAYDHGKGTLSLRECMRISEAAARGQSFLRELQERERTGSAENPITKMFPATLTERRFLDELDEICEKGEGFSYVDDREAGHGLSDFTITHEDLSLPINIKNAGTRFYRASDLVGLHPDDCVPIPAYKAYGAIESLPSLLYVVSVDFELVERLESMIPGLLCRDELIVWDLLNRFTGKQVRSAEDEFVISMIHKYWGELSEISQTPFNVISARKAIKILQRDPSRTPGIGMKAWGTGANAEVNVHVSIADDMTPWEEIKSRILDNGLGNIIAAVNRKRVEEVFDPEI